MARAAYVKDAAALRVYLARPGFELTQVLDAPGAQGFVAADTATAVLAFRGTESDDRDDLLTDARIALKPWPAGGRVHTGFADALLPLLDRVRLPAGKRLLFTGHSLGAALATLAATRWRPAALYTFGSPHVGDAEFVRVANETAHTRFVDCCDRVCRALPEWMGYRHCGRLAFIDRRGRLREGLLDGDTRVERWTAAWTYFAGVPFHGGVLLRDAADHAALNYASAVLGVRQA